MLPFLLGAAAVGWLAGESIRRGRSLGQRGLPGPVPLPPGESFTRCQKLLAEIDQTLKAALENYQKARELSERAKAIQLELGAHPGWRTGPGFEDLRRRFEEMQSLMRDAQTHNNAGQALERGWRDLWEEYRRECEPRAQGMLAPPRAPMTSQMIALTPSASPVSQTVAPAVGPEVSMIQEATLQPAATPRPRISVPLPAGGGMAIPFSGT